MGDMQRDPIEALFSPRSIAIVGASPDSWYASRLVEHLLAYGFAGDVYYVNPNRERIRGEPCYDAIGGVPAVVDLVVVSIPREHVVGTVRAAAERGTPAALVISAGFDEADETGTRLQVELADVVDEYGIALCGPNTIGFANVLDGVVVSATCSRRPTPGSVGLVSQSGALAFSTFFDRATDEDLHFAYIVATGNEVGLDFAEYVEYLAADPRVDVICLYLEGVSEPRAFMAAAADAVTGGTPVLAVKIGRSDDAQRATVSHTGSITGNDDVWDAALVQAGVERVEDIPDLLHRASVHSAFEPPETGRVCVLSSSGGLASLLADLVADRGLELPPLSPATERTLLEREDLLTFGEMPNPADIRGYGADILPEIAEVVFADDRFDAYLIAVALPAVGERAEPLAERLLEVAEMAEQPVVILWTGRKVPDERGPEALPYERVRRELPLYYDPARAVDALASLVRFGEAEPRVLDPGIARERVTPSPMSVPSDEVLPWSAALELLEPAGIDVVEARVVTDAAAAEAAVETIGGPVAMKVDCPALPHRSDVGAVAIDVDLEAAGATFERLTEAARGALGDDPSADVEGAVPSTDRVLVQPMCEGVEILVGASTDELFGPVLTVGLGGTLVEERAERTVLVPPVDRETVSGAIEGTDLDAVLAGPRGGVPADREALIDLVVAVGDLVVADERIEELDLNPVLVDETGATAVDVLCKTAE